MRPGTNLPRPGWALVLWLAAFTYAAAVAVAVQFVVLPYLFPRWHAGEGLLVGGDWLEYHRLAVGLASEIHQRGWGAWQLRPAGHAAAGIAAVVYALTTPKPWALIPLNAALHATAAVVLFRLVGILAPNPRTALVAVVPFVVYPSAVTWYAQVLKDGYAVLGYLMFLYGWALLVRRSTWESGLGPPVRAVAWVAGGAALNWMVRPHVLQIMQFVGIGLALLVTGASLARSLRRGLPWRRAMAATVVAWASLMLLSVGRFGPSQEGAAPTNLGQASSQSPSFLRRVLDILDERAREIGAVRTGYRLTYPTAASNVDTDVRIASIQDVVRYLPRAAVLAFLAPFPRHWLATGSAEPSTFARRLAGIEMLGVYLALPWLLYAIGRWRARAELYTVVFFCAGMMILYTVIVPNLGALHRLRYAFLMSCVAVGLAATVTRLQEWRTLGASSCGVSPEGKSAQAAGSVSAVSAGAVGAAVARRRVGFAGFTACRHEDAGVTGRADSGGSPGVGRGDGGSG